MKVELNIADDRELRNYIKDVIKGVVVEIARGEIRGIIADVVREGYIPKDVKDLDKIVVSIIQQEVQSQIVKNGGWNQPNFIHEETRKIILAEVQKYFQAITEKRELLMK